MRFIAPLMAAALVAGCQKAPSGQAPVTAAAAEQIAQKAEANFTTGNADNIMAQYANKAVMFDAAAGDPSDDRKVQSAWAKNFNSMKPADYKVTQRRIQIVGPDAFVSSGIESFTVQAGVARPTVSARFTDVFQRQGDGTWKIVHEHVSSPPPTANAN